MSHLVDTQRSLLFRRQRFIARHRKRPVWLRLWRPFAQASLLVGAPALLAWWVLTAPQFTLRQVSSSTPEHIDPEWVMGRLADHRGLPLVSMPMERIEESLSAHPWVESVQVRKELPDRLRVAITERVPVVVRRDDNGAEFIDQNGRQIAPYAATSRWSDLPVVEGPDDAVTLANAVVVLRGLRAQQPGWADQARTLQALTDTDFAVVTSALPFTLVVSADGVGQQAVAVSTYLARVRREFPEIEQMDLRVPGSIVVKPVTREE